MPDFDKFYKILGLANRAGKLQLGMAATLKSLKRKKTRLLIFSEDVSQNGRRKVEAATSSNVKIVEISNKSQLGQTLGRGELGIIAVEDDHFSSSLQKLTAEN